MKTKIVLVGMIIGGLCIEGCSVVPSSTTRAVASGIGAAAGGTAGYELGGKKLGWTIAGAGLGALATLAAQGDDPAVKRQSFDDGYIQGQADAIKRQYFLRQALEAKPLADNGEPEKIVHYTVPGPTVTSDGRKLEPHTVTLSVTE